MPESNFGPRLTAFVALCTGRFRLSKRLVQELLSDVLGVEVADGSASNMEQVTSAALAAPVEEARAFVQAQPVVHQDETGWWEGGSWPGSGWRRLRWSRCYGLSEKRCYDAVGRVSQMVVGRGGVSDACAAGTLVSRFAYGYDANGNRLSQEEQRTEAGVTSVGAVERTEYGYDPLDRLIGTKDPDGTATLYRLDPVGNRLGERKTLASKVAALTVAAFAALAPADATADTTSVFNRADWLVSLTDAKDAGRNRTFEYDLNGNLVEKTAPTSVRTFQWDIRNTLTSVTEGGSLLGRYDYDWNKQRVKRTTASERVEYVLDDDYVLEEASGASADHPITRRYHYGDGEAVGVSDIAREVAGPGGPVTSTQFLLYDALGSLTTLTNVTGAIADTRQYDAWGKYRNGSPPTAGETKFAFTGHQFDPETGLIYARARYYDAELGLFVSRDPSELLDERGGRRHLYVYARVNPLAYTDFSGLCETGEPGCELGSGLFRALWASVFADETYQHARQRVIDENYAEMQESGPSMLERADGKFRGIVAWVGEVVEDSQGWVRNTFPAPTQLHKPRKMSQMPLTVRPARLFTP